MSRISIRRAAAVAAIAGTAALVVPALSHAEPTGSLGSLGSADGGSSIGSLGGSLGGSSTGSLGGSLGGSSDAPAGGFTCESLSTEATPAGWGIPFDDEQGQEASYSASGVFDRNGSLELAVDGPSDRAAWYHSAGGVKLADVVGKEIGFAEKAATSTASFQMRLLGTTGGKFENGFTTLVWVAEPGTTSTSDGGMHDMIQNGQWWSTQNIDGAKDRVPTTLAAISAANPNATVEHYGVSVGTGSAETSTLVDAVTFNGCTTDFATNAPAAPATGSGSGSGAGSLGSLSGSTSS